MHHAIDTSALGAHGQAMSHAVASCVHCGFCLPACPTYRVLGEEMDSPRGRIVLMKEVLEGTLSATEAGRYIDRCLGCFACVTACPSGVQYGELLAPYRWRAEDEQARPASQRLMRAMLGATLPYPRRFRAAAAAARRMKFVRGALPPALRILFDLLPAAVPKAHPLPEVYPAEGTRRARVALLAGCVQQVLAPEIGWAALRVLARNGVEVIVPAAQGCCGSLSMHSGDATLARRLASRNLRAFAQDVDAVVVTAAGCGSGMKEYALLFRGRPEEEAAERLARRTVDISVFLHTLGIESPAGGTRTLRVAYHDACHLAHAQGVRSEPRALLRAIPGVTVVAVPDGDICCGSAGTYNIEQPDIARRLGEDKAAQVLATGADCMASGNVGCLMQLRTHLARRGAAMPCLHTVELLDRAYAGTL